MAQGLAQGPLGLVVDIAQRGLLLDELRARRDLWQQREPMLAGQPAAQPLPPPRVGAQRPVPLPAGPVETYSSKAVAGALVGAAATLAATRDPHLMVAATATANPKSAKLGREGFAARVDRDLARSGVLAMDTDALRRLDRIDAVVLDTRVLTSGRMVVGSVWVPPEHHAETEAAVLAAHALLHEPANPPETTRPHDRGSLSTESTDRLPRSSERAPAGADIPAIPAIPAARSAANGLVPAGAPSGGAARAAAMAAHPPRILPRSRLGRGAAVAGDSPARPGLAAGLGSAVSGARSRGRCGKAATRSCSPSVASGRPGQCPAGSAASSGTRPVSCAAAAARCSACSARESYSG